MNTVSKITYIEDVDDGIEDDNDDLRVLGFEQIAQRLEHAHLHHVADLVSGAARRQVGDHPNGFLLALEVSLKMRKTLNKCSAILG